MGFHAEGGQWRMLCCKEKAGASRCFVLTGLNLLVELGLTQLGLTQFSGEKIGKCLIE